MKAIVYRRFGGPDVLELAEVETPVPREDEVLIRVRAASVNPADWHFMRGTPYIGRIAMGFRAPKVQRLGIDVAGVVEAAGANVTTLQPGDEVFGASQGSFAEYVCTSVSKLVTKPKNVTFEQAAAVNIAALTALQALRDKGRLRAGQKVLINGASGGVGTFAVQIAKALGAIVTGVCSTRNAELVRSIGAERVIDYTRDDFTREIERYDVFLDCIGNHSLIASRRMLASEGICVMVGAPSGRWIAPLPRLVAALTLSLASRRKLTGMLAKSNKDDLALIAGMMENGQVTPVIDHTYTLSEAPEAIRYLETGHARGKVVIAL